MNSDIATSILKEIHRDIVKFFQPDLDWNIYRDGGSVAFTLRKDNKFEIVLIAPVHTFSTGPSRVGHSITYAYVLKPGCNNYYDYEKEENLIGSVSFDYLGLFPPSKFDIKRQINDLLTKRLK